MELRQLKTFMTVASTLSFHRTAEILHYAQSTVSAQIRTLEESLGVVLFNRLGKRISLTSAGEKLLRYAERLLNLEEEILTELSDVREPQATLSIRMPQTLANVYLPEIIAGFKSKYPGVGLDINTCTFHSLPNELKTGIVDLAFLFAEKPMVPELKIEVLSSQNILLVVHRQHHLAEKKKLTAEDLRNETLLLPKHDCAYKMELERSIAENKLRSLTIMEFNSVESIKQCISRNIGIGLLPELMLKTELERGDFVILPVLYDNPPVNILMIRHRNKWLSPALKAFIKESRSVFKS